MIIRSSFTPVQCEIGLPLMQERTEEINVFLILFNEQDLRFLYAFVSSFILVALAEAIAIKKNHNNMICDQTPTPLKQMINAIV